MIVVYDSLTGMGKRFALNISKDAISIKDLDLLQEECILITRSFGFGNISEETKAFLDSNKDMVIGVAVTGNKNWGSLYGNAAKLINQEYGIPIIHIFEGSGFEKDRQVVQNFIDEVKNGTNAKMAVA